MKKLVFILVFLAFIFSANSQNKNHVLHSKLGSAAEPDSVFNFYDVNLKLAIKERYREGNLYGKWVCFDERGIKVDSIDYTLAYLALNGLTPIQVPDGKCFFIAEQMPWFFTSDLNYMDSSSQLFIDNVNRLPKKYSNVKVFLPAITINGREKVANPELGVFMKQYFLPSIKYPRRAVQNKKDGSVYVMFTVNKEGNVVDPKIIRSADIDLSYEVVRVLLRSPQWEPGMQRGEAVDVRYIIHIQFKIQ